MNTVTKKLPLSENATGIRSAETLSYNVNGITEKCENISFEVRPLSNHIIVKYNKVYFNSNGDRLDVKPIEKKIIVKDEPEEGTIQIDEQLNEVEGSYVKTKDEALNVTDWDNQLGSVMIPSLIDFVSKEEGYI